MTKRPEITAENYQAVYDYFSESRTKPCLSRAIYRLCYSLYQPDVHLEDDDRDAIRQQLELGKGALLAMNHPSHHDPFVGAAGMYGSQIPELTDCTAFAKDSLFRGVTRPLFEYTGCLPVFRHKSYPNLDRRAFNTATNQLLGIASKRLQEGKTVSILPEGTTSRPEALANLEFQDIKSGIARVALSATDEHSFIVPIAIAYQESSHRHASIAIGGPVTEYESNSRDIRQQVLVAMQSQLDRAHDLL